MTLQTDLLILLPELILAIGALVLLLVGAFNGNKATPAISWAAILVMVASGITLIVGPAQGVAFHGAFIADDFGRYAKILILIGSVLSILLADEFFANIRIVRFELPVLMMIATVGMMLMVSSASFLSLYMGLELQSLALYILAAFNRSNIQSTEAGLKYFVLGALSSGMMLFGLSYIYGFTGSVEFSTIAKVIAQSGVGLGLTMGLVFLIAGLAFKVAAVPFHMWSPDVYEGAPTPITGYFATAAKVAAMSIFLRALLTPFPGAIHEWRQIILFVSILSMILGAVAALGQTNIKRLMAYSSIGHAGYMLLGLAAGTALGVRGVLVYLAIYLFTNLGVFAAIQAMRRSGVAVESISDLAGLARTRPRLALVFAALFMSLAGLPPLAGFFAKFYVFMAVIQAGLIWPAVIGVLSSAVALVYYLKLVRVMYFDEPALPFDEDMRVGTRATLVISSIVILFFVFGASPTITLADAASHTLLR
jgi:NADH-quinone oxidoreductase subunit N